MNLRYSHNDSDLRDIILHLEDIDDQFSPALNSRVNIEEYAHRIVSNADRLECWHDNKLIGLVACYMNLESFGFITHVGVLANYSKQGIAGKLLKSCLELAEERKMDIVQLEVEKNNLSALRLYSNFGFKDAGVANSDWLKLSKQI